MADVAEVLMIEHEAIRHISRFITPSSELSLADFHKYLKAVHIEIEEKISVSGNRGKASGRPEGHGFNH